MQKTALPKVFLVLCVIIAIVFFSGCLCPLSSIFEQALPQIPTFTPTSTQAPTLTPTIMLTPTPTSTPTPQQLDLYYLYDNCSALSQNHETVIVEGRIFLPEFKILSLSLENTTWTGVQLKQFLESETRYLTILIPNGEGPGTIDTIPIPFHEKDLIIHDDDNRTIRHYHSVIIKGQVDYVKKEDGSRCQIWIESIQSNTLEEIQIPKEVNINFLQKRFNIGTNIEPLFVTNCDLLAQKHQMVTVSGSIFSLGTNLCNNVSCTFQFSDNTGSLGISLAYREGPNSVFKPKGKSWEIFDKSNNPISLYSLKLTGVLYNLREGCTLSVYEIENR